MQDEENWENPKALLKPAAGNAKAGAGMALTSPAEVRALRTGLGPKLEVTVQRLLEEVEAPTAGAGQKK